MTRHPLLLLPALALLLGAGWPLPGLTQANAEATGAADDATAASFLEALGSPARPLAVRHLVRSALADGANDAERLAEALGRAGGHAALNGSVRLLRSRDPAVRVSALRAIERIGLRNDRAAGAVFPLAAEGRGGERRSAIAALGVVGDGRDVALLLDIATSEAAEHRAAAFAALRRLAGVSIPAVHARWAWHWRQVKRRAASNLPAALERLDQSPDDATAEALCAEIRSHAWADLELLDEYLRPWLRSDDRAKWRNACRLVSDLRLADYADALLDVRAGPDADDAVEARDRAIRVLGVAEPERSS